MKITDNVTSREVRLTIAYKGTPEEGVAELSVLPAIGRLLDHLNMADLVPVEIIVVDGKHLPAVDNTAYTVVAEVVPIDEAPW